MKDINITLTKDEYLIIRRALESHYYLSKDEGDDDYMRKINELEAKIIKETI